MSTWQTMDSAPISGQPILAWDGTSMAVVFWDDTLAGTKAPSQWALQNRFATDAMEPTHWQPLPAPPQPGESNARFIAGPATPSKR